MCTLKDITGAVLDCPILSTIQLSARLSTTRPRRSQAQALLLQEVC